MSESNVVKAQLIVINEAIGDIINVEELLNHVLIKMAGDEPQILDIEGEKIEVKLTDVITENVMRGILRKFITDLHEAFVTRKVILEETLEDLQ